MDSRTEFGSFSFTHRVQNVVPEELSLGGDVARNLIGLPTVSRPSKFPPNSPTSY